MRPSRLIPAVLLLLALPADAAAAPPSNDDRATPRTIALPATVQGTTVDSTLETDEPQGCQALKGSVYYEVDPGQAKRLTLRVAADGDLDATVEVFRRNRSQLSSVGCESTDDDGKAEVTLRPDAGARYLVRVGQRANSVAGTFTLQAFVPSPPPTGPGPQLPRAGVRRTLDQLGNTADAWSTRLREGGRYRVNLASLGGEKGCVKLQVFAPGAKEFDDADPDRTLRCGGYAVITPGRGEGGRWSFLATAAPRTEGPQPYHLQVAASGPDDTAPGTSLKNLRPAHGTLDAQAVDVVDVYRFTIRRRSSLKLDLGGGAGFQMRLLTTGGRTVDSSDEGSIDRNVGRGRYLVAVQAPKDAKGRYALTRTTRTITRTSVRIDGRVKATVGPGATTRIGVRTSPGVSGTARVTIERFDPLEGWQFFRSERTRISGGRGGVSFSPPTTGRWRARADYLGTRTAAPSSSGVATVSVETPIPQG